jgi:hypothetical protein
MNKHLVQRVIPYGDQIQATIANNIMGLEIWSSAGGYLWENYTCRENE